MFLAVAYSLYVYARPYKSTYVNIIEIVLLGYLGIFLGLIQLEELQEALVKQLDNTTIDSCGNEVPSIGVAEIVLGMAYFLPVTVLLFCLGWWLFRVIRTCWYDMCLCMFCMLYVVCIAIPCAMCTRVLHLYVLYV